MLGTDATPVSGLAGSAWRTRGLPAMDERNDDEAHDSRAFVVMVWREHFRDRYILGLHHTRHTATEALGRFLVKYPAGAGTIDPYFVA